MKENTKFKMIFGKEVGKKDFSDLQKESKLLKPASLSKLLGKRDWKLEPIPELQISENLLQIQKSRKMRKLARSRSFCDEATETRALNKEARKKIVTHCLPNPEQLLSNSQAKLDKFNKQLNIGRPGMAELPTAENFEHYLAYNLRNVFSSKELKITYSRQSH